METDKDIRAPAGRARAARSVIRQVLLVGLFAGAVLIVVLMKLIDSLVMLFRPAAPVSALAPAGTRAADWIIAVILAMVLAGAAVGLKLFADWAGRKVA